MVYYISLVSMPEREAEDSVIRTPLPCPILIHTQHYIYTSSSINIKFSMARTQDEFGQIVFQISVPQTQEAPYHARRPHSKSRTGCLACKKRRIKVCHSDGSSETQLTLVASATRLAPAVSDAKNVRYLVAMRQTKNQIGITP